MKERPTFTYTKNLITLLLAVILLSVSAMPAFCADRLVLVTPMNTVDTVVGEVIIREAYRRLGIEVQIKKYPAERAIRLANYGEVDGEVQRIDGIAKKYKHLIQIWPPVNFLEAAVFSKSVAFDVLGWESLRPYRIGFIRGIKFAERYTADMNAHAVSGYPALFRMLGKGRFDIVLSPGINGRFHMKQAGVKDVHELKPAVMHFDLFHYLHRKNANLVSRISAVLDEMKQSGELQELRQHVFSVLMTLAKDKLPICDQDYKCFERDPS
jgi:ABC-type amino acid transport substrate-binding protein